MDVNYFKVEGNKKAAYEAASVILGVFTDKWEGT